MPLLYRSDLDDIANSPCGKPGCEDDHATRYLHPRCHPGRTEVSYTLGEKFIRVGCAECGKQIAEIAVAERPHPGDALVAIEFHQARWPDSAPMPNQEVDRPRTVAAAAHALAARGCTFHAMCNPETARVAFWCRTDRHGVIAREDSPNDHNVLAAVDRLVYRAEAELDRLDAGAAGTAAPEG